MRYARILRTVIPSLAILIAVSSCAGGCAGIKPIRPLESDIEVISDDLVQDILDHNDYVEKRCGWTP